MTSVRDMLTDRLRKGMPIFRLLFFLMTNTILSTRCISHTFILCILTLWCAVNIFKLVLYTLWLYFLLYTFCLYFSLYTFWSYFLLLLYTLHFFSIFVSVKYRNESYSCQSSIVEVHSSFRLSPCLVGLKFCLKNAQFSNDEKRNRERRSRKNRIESSQSSKEEETRRMIQQTWHTLGCVDGLRWRRNNDDQRLTDQPSARSTAHR